MKLREKILIIFLLSIIVSVSTFLFVNWWLINYGQWAGIDSRDIDSAADGTVSRIQKLDSLDYKKAKPILDQWKRKYNGMELELFSKEFKLVYTTASSQQIGNLRELIQNLALHEEFSRKRWVTARNINLSNADNGYLVIIVPEKYFTAIYYSINGYKGAGFFGELFIIGLGITLIVSSFLAYLFSLRISGRFNKLYKEISKFELGSIDIGINDRSKDEIGYLGTTFQKMAVRLKNQFDNERIYHEKVKKLVSDISHDIRTPLTSIIGYSEALENNFYEKEEDKKNYVMIIRKKALYMERLLSELLDFSALELGHATMNKQRTDVSEMSREILIEYLPTLQENDMEINVNIPEHSLFANIDIDGISRVIRNLIDNAIKYGKNGVVIGFSLTETEDLIKLEIRDKGNGIEDKNLELVFKRFFQEDKSRNAKHSGIGLGLAIANEIVKMHEGQILVESIPDKGSVFTVILPKG